MNEKLFSPSRDLSLSLPKRLKFYPVPKLESNDPRSPKSPTKASLTQENLARIFSIYGYCDPR